jgi:hypothetical protein
MAYLSDRPNLQKPKAIAYSNLFERLFEKYLLARAKHQ